jgi:uncharacterized protein YdcH (DUF465 family)
MTDLQKRNTQAVQEAMAAMESRVQDLEARARASATEVAGLRQELSQVKQKLIEQLLKNRGSGPTA